MRVLLLYIVLRHTGAYVNLSLFLPAIVGALLKLFLCRVMLYATTNRFLPDSCISIIANSGSRISSLVKKREEKMKGSVDFVDLMKVIMVASIPFVLLLLNSFSGL